MKINNLIGLFAGVSLMAFSACEPIEDRDVLSNSFEVENIELKVVQATEGGNKMSVQMLTPGVTGYWDYILDTKSSDRVEVVFPFTGEHTFTYYATTPYMTNGKPGATEFLSKTVSVKVDKLDEPLPEAYYALVGDDLGGKTWVFDKEHLWFDGRVAWWVMVAGYNWQELWWDSNDPIDPNGKMVFDLKGAPNYTYHTGPDDAGSVGSFAFNGDFTTITFKNQPILGSNSDRVNPESIYEIKALTSEQMILYTPTNGGGTGWLWVFKAVEEI
ncbi:hypothetical protein SAMN06265379_10584 [Saccharicrinis carchari]|uniref:PKD domain-containing protein n=1 Tax=Saccharicrinis carchari TaxID=1168039 RepID=A0A521DD57_SACCC|nr:hypothetical protein [Saccharicrinis carchari]SMO69609.1 hypothetical protein SAMN06265379_10584 [Saccharicrinis carchari]